ncbi:methyltransferase domain-containing protein [Streptomyces sp. JJ36]|uniref:methyltransferase domain-containing protein n=1 Tax=Streptomyces sp. JJ36 TaxID=2736645 RepID=UPI001F015F95|nr:methyltransferase domain-containing protein [Streptomyces sp. JJ36]MCF6524797.1 methyltransferase domain-containing protein [Streptomyces sp. JJ36]
MSAAWSGGEGADYAAAGAAWSHAAQDVTAAALARHRRSGGPRPRVLDVGTGTGPAALAAAAAGADTVGLDLEQGMLRLAADRARQQDRRLPGAVRFLAANALALPFRAGTFDVVLPTFGVMFAPDPARAAAELVRVTRPGGVLAVASWTPDGVMGRIAPTVTRHLDHPPTAAPPTRWGDPAHLAAWFGPLPATHHTRTAHVDVRYPSVFPTPSASSRTNRARCAPTAPRWRPPDAGSRPAPGWPRCSPSAAKPPTAPSTSAPPVSCSPPAATDHPPPDPLTRRGDAWGRACGQETTMRREQHVARAFVGLVDTVSEEFDPLLLFGRLARACVELLDAEAAGVILADARGYLRTVAASQDGPDFLELQRLRLGPGPCQEACRTRHALSLPDLAREGERWPGLGPAAEGAGFRALYVVPLTVRHRGIGAVSLLRTRAGHLPEPHQVLAQALADTAATSLARWSRRPATAQDLVCRVQSRLMAGTALETAHG